MTTVEILEKARGLIDTPDKWVQVGGQHVGTDECAHCAGNAIAAACGWQGDDYAHKMKAARALADAAEIDAAAVRADLMLAIYRWNDAPERTHAEVLDAFDRAIAAEKAKVNP